MTLPTSPADAYRNTDIMNRVRRIADEIFARHGIDFLSAKRAGGWTNATWLAGDLALRVSVRPGNENLLREARLGALLPPEAGYPAPIETGEVDGLQWALAPRIPGRCLGEDWDDLSWNERISALEQLWRKMRAVHRVDLEAVSGLARTTPWFQTPDTAQACALLAELARQGILTAEQAGELGRIVARFWQVRPGAACVLNHGDLSFDNILWQEGQITALLDFEYAVIAPAELDLTEWFKCAFAQGGAVDVAPDLRGKERTRARERACELAAPVIAHPGGADLLYGYAVLLELWKLVDGLEHPEGEGPLEQWDSLANLRSLADGQGGYLAPVLELAG